MESHQYIATANRACSLLYSYIREHADRLWLLPVNVCPDVPLTFCLAKVAFKFIDIDSDTLCIDLNEVEKILHQSTSGRIGLLFVRTYGVLKDTSKDFKRLKSVCRDTLIIDDRCLCIPERTPSFWGADMVLYSTGHCKQIDLGGGGLAFYSKMESYKIDPLLEYNGTDEEIIYKKAFKQGRQLESIPNGWLRMGSYDSPNVFFSKIEEAIPERLAYREQINRIYVNNLPSSIQLSQEFQNWRFNIVVERTIKESILSNLFKYGLFASTHYHSANRLFDNVTYTNSDELYSGVINLFNDKYYTEEQAMDTCKIINITLGK
ncbi:MAG: hypothetical protein IKW84_09765 [Bacteroidaceae bacterium]|nr:hypothetical protein [Bacteroidaceae bacterium]